MATTESTPYDMLGLKKSDPDLAIRTAYRNLIHKLKEDRLKSSEARKITPEAFRLICRAYETLSDNDKKKQYDTTGKWTSSVLLDDYTLQQLAAEPDLILQLTNRLRNATLVQINAKDPATQLTALHCAARACNVEAVRYLTSNDADSDTPNRTGSSTLHAGAFYGHPEVVQCLLEGGAKYDIKNNFGNIPEAEAMTPSVGQIFETLRNDPYVQAAANQLDWFKANYQKISQHIDHQYFFLRQTLLHCASKKGHIDLVRWLVEVRGVNLDIIDVNSNSALHLAASYRHVSIVEYLLDRGANSLLTNKWGMTAEEEGLRHARVIKNIFQAMRAQDMFSMAANGADWWFRYHFNTGLINATNSDGASVLYIAARLGKPAVVEWLLDNGANVNMRLAEGSKSTALHAAVFHDHLSIVEMLLSHGADVNIKNGFNSTAFDDARTDAMKKFLQQYRKDLQEEKLLSVHLFGDGSKSGKEALAKVQLPCDATVQDLINALPNELSKNFGYFSIARRPLKADDEKATLVSIFARARHGKSQLIELPLCLIAHERARYVNSGHVLSPALSFPGLRSFIGSFTTSSQFSKLTVKAQSPEVQHFTCGTLQLTFPSNCVQENVSVKVTYVLSPTSEIFQPQGCLCLFELDCQGASTKFNELPTVSLTNAPDARLCCWTQSSAYWLTTNTKQTRLFSFNRVHALVRQTDVIPSLLTLPADVFIGAAVGKPLHSRNQPVVCQALKIRDHNTSAFPDIAYHGTQIAVLKSILADGLVMPNTFVSSGLRVCPPSNHIARGTKAFDIDDFANGIFVSPSIWYCSDPAYAVTFPYNGQVLFPVLELSVKRGEYKAFPSTVPNYTPHPTDNIKAIEWRLTNPAAIETLSVLFIPLMTSRISVAQSRAKKLGVDPHCIT